MALSSCPICGGHNIHQVFTLNGYSVLHCQKCKTRFISPQPDDNVLKSIYTKDYFLGDSTPQGKAEVSRLKSYTAKLYLDLLSGYVPNPVGKFLLEVGSGSGDFLYEARKRGFCVSGLEISESAAAQANEKLGGSFVQTKEESVSPGSIDVLIMADVIEHFRNPRESLKHFSGLLNPTGILFITTPAVDSLLAKAMGKHWAEYKTEHLYYFGKVSIKQILEDTGFDVLTVVPNQKVLSMDYIIRHFIRFSVPFITPIMTVTHRFLPADIRNYPFKIRTSSVNIIARKRI